MLYRGGSLALYVGVPANASREPLIETAQCGTAMLGGLEMSKADLTAAVAAVGTDIVSVLTLSADMSESFSQA